MAASVEGNGNDRLMKLANTTPIMKYIAADNAFLPQYRTLTRPQT
jgi:hypothetical protein